MKSKLTDSQLLQQIAQGNKKAIGELYDQYSSPVYRFLLKMTQFDEDQSKDLLHDVFLKIINKADAYNPNYKASTWIFTIASNTFKSAYTKLKPIVPLEIDIPEEEIEQKTSYPIQAAINQLEDQFREIITLKYLQGLQIKEISEITNCPVGTVKSRLFYGLRKLNQLLKNYEENV